MGVNIMNWINAIYDLIKESTFVKAINRGLAYIDKVVTKFFYNHDEPEQTPINKPEQTPEEIENNKMATSLISNMKEQRNLRGKINQESTSLSDKMVLHGQLEVKSNEMMAIMSNIPSDKILKNVLDAVKKQLSDNISNLHGNVKDLKQEYKVLSKQDSGKEFLHLKACQKIFSTTPEVFKAEIDYNIKFDTDRRQLSQQNNTTATQAQEQIIDKNANNNPSKGIPQDIKTKLKECGEEIHKNNEQKTQSKPQQQIQKSKER